MKTIFDLLVAQKQIEYPKEMIKIEKFIKQKAFFPGGYGILDNDITLSEKTIMVLGQDYGCEKDIDDTNEHININPTWKNIKSLLTDSGINHNECFFTNALMGVRVGEVSIGKNPVFKDKDSTFVKSCQEFFIAQCQLIKPKLIIVLGLQPAYFLSNINQDLSLWKTIKSFKHLDKNNNQIKLNIQLLPGFKTNLVVLVHPSMRYLNARNRVFMDKKGHESEIHMIKFALANVIF